MSSPVWVTPAGFLGTLSERRTISIPVVATTTGTDLSYSVISGQLPVGVYLNPTTGLLLGTPVSVALDTDTTFVIRAQDSIGIADRTFAFTTTGVDEPVWVTSAGLLPVGPNGEMYAINQQYVDYTVRAETDILLSGNRLKYFIADNQGQLPPGLTLSQDGVIRGYIDDNLILDEQASTNGGYDTNAYDLYPFENNSNSDTVFDPTNILGQLNINDMTLSDPVVVYTDGFHGFTDGRLVFIQGATGLFELNGNDTGYYVKVYSANSFALYTDQQLQQSVDTSEFSPYLGQGRVVWGTATLGKPQVINKTYQFSVTVTDGIASIQRIFNIDVVDRNSLRVDNTFLSVDSDWFDSSAGYLLAPIWQSKYGNKLPQVANLGTVRASREQILTVYDYDPYPLDGPTIFSWNTLTVNPDIRLVADSGVGAANLATQNLRGQNSIYFKDAEIIPVKGMQIRIGEYISGGDATTYTVTGVIKLTDSSGILNIDQPLALGIPDARVFYAGTASRRPPGLSLDPLNGNIYGRLQYQPAYSDSYRFTVQVVKINQSRGDITLNDASQGVARIVGKRFFEGLTVSTTATMASAAIENLIPDAKAQLPDPMTYTGLIGDIILVGIADNVVYDDLLTVMGGTTYAFIYTDPDNNPSWEYLGDTVVSSQIYLLTVLGEITSSIQWISTSSLGSIFPGQISELAVKAVNTNTNYSIGYELISGQLPQGLVLDYDGTIKGKITNLGQTYFDFAAATASFVGSISQNVLTVNTVTGGEIVPHQYITTTATNPGLVTATFIMSGSNNTWIVTNHTTSTTFDIVSTSTATIQVGTSTEIIILTTTTSVTTSSIDLSTSSFNATTVSPFSYANGLLSIDNNLTTVDQSWYFTVRASDAYRLSAVEKEFFITVNTDTLSNYTRIYVKPFMLRDKRKAYRDFITDSLIFDPVLIYRPNDPEFGVQPQIKMLIETGIEQVDLDLYAQAMQEYFYRKRFYFGEVKSILAQDSAGNNVYEIIYIDIIDDQMIGIEGVENSVVNMQNQLEAIQIDSDTILVDERLQPKYMTTLNADTGVPLGFIKAVPLCYTIPGGAIKILSRINNAITTGAFTFNQFDFDTDRIIVETVKDTEQTGWLAYPTDRR